MFPINNDKPGMESAEVVISTSVKFDNVKYIDIYHYMMGSNDEQFLADVITLDVKQAELLIDMLQSRLKVLKLEDKPVSDPANDEYYIYTDGGANGNPGSGGWAYVATLRRGIVKEVHNRVAYPDTTNGKMELQAVIEALRWLAHTPHRQARILSDSRYVIDGINKNQNRKVNKELWQELDKWRNRLGVRVSFEWIPRDSSPFNRQADRLSKEVR